MKRVLVLSTCSDDGKKLAWCLREAGHHAFALGPAAGNEALSHSPLCGRFFETPPAYGYEKRSPELLPLIAAAVESAKIDVIVPSGFESLKFVSRHRDHLRRIARVTAVPSLEMIAELGNKRSFAEFCARHGIPHPRTVVIERADDVLRDGLQATFPLMTKPYSMAEGKGIHRFDDRKELHAYLAAPRPDGQNALPLLLQEFVPGDDIDFNGFCAGGRLVAWNIQRFRWFGAGTRWLQFERNDEVLRIGRRIVELTRYDGPIHIDMRIDSRDGSVKTIEVNPRFWGSLVASICDGVNYGGAAVRQAFDAAYAEEPRATNRVWGMPHRLPGMLLKHGGRDFYAGLSRHTLFQLKYMALDLAFSLISRARGKRTPRPA